MTAEPGELPSPGMPRPGGAARPGPRRHRLLLLAPGGLALLGGLWGGLLRLGWELPPIGATLVAHHGPLMVAAFLGTVIGMERAVALGATWAYAAPLLTGLGGLTLIAGLAAPVGASFMTTGSAVVVAVFVAVLGRQAALHTAVMAFGALLWLAGQVLWLAGSPVHRVVPWWMGFLLLTIAGERLELARLMRISSAARALFIAAIGITLAGLGLSLAAPGAGMRLVGLGMAGLAAWLMSQDIARRTVRQPGLTRFIAVCLLSGYVWLAAGGVLVLAIGDIPAGPLYDAALHAFFVGFVFSMIFGHAPIILPAVLGLRVPFTRAFYAHLVLLHASLGVRIVGDLLGWLPGRHWGGLVNVLALLLFLGNTLRAALGHMRAGPDRA